MIFKLVGLGFSTSIVILWMNNGVSRKLLRKEPSIPMMFHISILSEQDMLKDRRSGGMSLRPHLVLGMPISILTSPVMVLAPDQWPAPISFCYSLS